ncbi:hypothetical protein OIY81_1840 [Cryptosporidium canis]|uniref:Uncharacterized protein n=1 Tax=Cryptosporidium canis TaxID=195482 RepID=A0ABQ8P4H4_9CRYT|nr:hypothetical protein OJ252_3544 [Cryptosporidium canis]KAJ1611009.1 hypothetical protein OIY81_1840 [Cryptosporidium canis]
MSDKIQKLSKSELVKILKKPTSSTREKNQAIKHLKKFPVNQKDELDKNLDDLKFKVNANKLFHFLCFRCDKPKQSNTQVVCKLKGKYSSHLQRVCKKSALLHFDLFEIDSEYTICHCCYLSLKSNIELKRIRAHNSM